MSTLIQPSTDSQTNGVTATQTAPASVPAETAGKPPAPNQLGRAFPRRDLLRGQSCISILCAGGAAVVLFALLTVVALTLHLLQSGGRVTLAAAETAEFESLTGLTAVARSLDDVGLGAVVWSARNEAWGDLLAAVFRGMPSLHGKIEAFSTLLVTFFVLALLFRSLLALAKSRATRAGLEVATRLRRNLHRQALRVGPEDLLEADRRRVHELFTADVETIRTAISGWIFLLATGVGFAVSLVVIAMLAVLADWRIAVYCLGSLLCCWYLFVRYRARQWESRRNETAVHADELAGLSEGFAKTRIIRGFGMDNFEHRAFQKDLDAFHGGIARTVRQNEYGKWPVWLLGAAAIVIVLFVLGFKALPATNAEPVISFATALFLAGVFGGLFDPLNRLSHLPRQWADAGPAAERVYRYLDRIPDVSQAVGAKFLQPLSSSLQFESVHYDAPGHGPLLKGIDLKLPARKVYAVVSHDPLESLALVCLVPRFIEPKSGRVLVDGEDIEWVTLESLRAESAYVGGKDPWFNGTILENIRCGNERRSLQDVTEAAKTVHAHQFISRLPTGYETQLGHSGVRLGPGESFRLALARAILQDPALLIIEEPDVPLDADTKSLLDDAYNRILPGRTVIFLPSRLSTVRRAETVVLLHNGKIEAIGKHAELVNSSAPYRHWEYQRFNEFRS
jgi:ABC-type multidrug transport system fused ATPase/permease subunit